MGYATGLPGREVPIPTDGWYAKDVTTTSSATKTFLWDNVVKQNNPATSQLAHHQADTAILATAPNGDFLVVYQARYPTATDYTLRFRDAYMYSYTDNKLYAVQDMLGTNVNTLASEVHYEPV
jgi:hypothetical protein